jgi:hypothetical protein
MRLPTLLIALLLPACGEGVSGIAVPPPMDMARIERPTTPNTALAAPAGFRPEPDIVTPSYPVPAPALYAAMVAVAEAQTRTYLLKAYDDQLQAHFVARSFFFRFPDLITVQVTADGPDRSNLVVWSRSVYGRSDLGVNRKRVAAWLAALGTKVPT